MGARALHVRALLALALALGLASAGCVAAPPPPNAVCAATPRETWIVRELAFVRADDRIADGFDLDDMVGGTCRVRDFVAPDGRTGIDNQLAALLPLVESQIGGQRLDELVQNAINNGQILLAFDLEGLDDADADGCVGVRLRRLSGTPLLGTDGYLLAGQTLYPDAMAPESLAEGGRIEGGVITAGPVDMALPVAILNANFVLDIDDALFRAEIDEEAGTMVAMVGGGVTTAQLIDVVGRTEGVPADVVALAETLLRENADLAPNAAGECQQFSAVIELRAVRGFVGE